MIRPAHQADRRPAYLAALLAYLALTLLMLAPVLPHMGDTILGGPVARRDAWQNVWNLWWVARALAGLQSPLHTPLLYYPAGADLHLQTLNLTNGVLVAPITALFGPTAGYNLAVILAFTLTGLGGYALALYVSGSRAAAFVGGLALTFAPFHMTKLWDGQLEMIALQWAPFYALFLLRAVEVGRRRDALLAGLFLALVGYTSWYYFLFFGVYSALFALVWLAWPPKSTKDTKQTKPSESLKTAAHPLPASPARGSFQRSLVPFVSFVDRHSAISQLALAAVTAAILMLPILLPALRDVGGGPGEDSGPDVFGYLKVIHSADLLDFWLPSALHPLWGGYVTRIGEAIHPYIAAWNVALGYVALALALAAILLRRRAAWRWWLIALAAIILSLGPILQVGGARTGLPMPYALLALVPGVGIAHRPSHFVVITVVLLAPLAALGLAVLLERFPQRYQVPAAVLAGALLLFELAPPAWPLFRSAPHPYYAQIAGSSGAVVDLPPRLESSEPLEAQLVHGLPMMGGYVSRTPSYPFGADTPVVRDLWAMAEGERVLVPSGPDDSLVVLNAYSLRHVIVHWRTLTPDQRAELERVLQAALPGVAPAFEDGELSAYLVPEAERRPFAYFRGGWYGEEREGERRWRWMGERGEVVVINPTGAPAEVRLTLTAQSYASERSVWLSFAGGMAGSWNVARADTSITLRLLAPPGESSLWLTAPADEEQGRSQRRLSIVITGARLG